MHYSLVAVAVAALASQVVAQPDVANKPRQNYGTSPSYVYNKTRADAVKQTFQISWDGYYKYAFPHDSLLPQTNGYQDDRNGWGASAIDAFSTAIVMGKANVVSQLLDYVPKINFNETSDQVSLFETTIRYLGGLLAAYDLLTDSSTSFNVTKKQTDAILTQAKNLADNLKVGFTTSSGVPDNNLRFNPPRRLNSSTNGLATIGSLVLEWTRLSDLTGIAEYAELAQKGEDYLLNPTPALGEPFPGLVGSNVNITNGEFLDGSGGWTGGTDSFYEYLIKMYLYDTSKFEFYKDRWVLAIESSIKYLASNPTTRPELTFLAYYENATSLLDISQHLACFDGGNFILGGLTLNNQTYIDFGLALTAGCHDTYTSTVTGIGPEQFNWADVRRNETVPADQAAFYAKNGFWISASDYVLRPEVMESYYYAYRATGDTKYQEWAWDAFVAINATCFVGSGYSSINDVNAVGGGGFQNFQESFWFAEVLKYSYMIHAEDSDWQVKANHNNRFVFNTEAHPVRVVGTPI